MTYTKTSRFLTLLLILSITIISQSTFASEENNFIVSIKSDLYDVKGYEAGCIAAKTALLLMDSGATVTLFPSLDSVKIANKTQLPYIDAVNNYVNEYYCKTSAGPQSVGQLISEFTQAGGTIMVCPLSWNTRYGEDNEGELIDGASVGSATSLSDMFIKAEKIIAF